MCEGSCWVVWNLPFLAEGSALRAKDTIAADSIWVLKALLCMNAQSPFLRPGFMCVDP